MMLGSAATSVKETDSSSSEDMVVACARRKLNERVREDRISSNNLEKRSREWFAGSSRNRREFGKSRNDNRAYPSVQQEVVSNRKC